MSDNKKRYMDASNTGPNSYSADLARQAASRAAWEKEQSSAFHRRMREAKGASQPVPVITPSRPMNAVEQYIVSLLLIAAALFGLWLWVGFHYPETEAAFEAFVARRRL